MASKNSGQRDNRRRLGAIEPEVVSARGLANRVVDRMVPSGPADFDGWTGGDVSRWLTVQAESFREVRRWIGLALLVLRERSPENVYMAEVKRIATAYDVHVGTLWRWRHQAEQAFVLARETRATADQDVPSDDTLPGEDQPPDGEDPEGSAEHVSSDSPRVPGAGSTRGAGPPTTQDGGTVPDQGPGGVEPGGVEDSSPQEPPPAPPERTKTVTAEWLRIIAKTPVEELRALGHVLVRDAVDRLAAADQRRLVTDEDWRTLEAIKKGEPWMAKPMPVGHPARNGAGQSTVESSSAAKCNHPKPWKVLPYGSFCAVPGCGVKVR